MKSAEEFQEFYSQELIKSVVPLEEYRLKNIRLLKRYLLIGISLAPLMAVGILTHHGVLMVLFALPSFIFLGLANQKHHRMNTYLRFRYKKRILNKAIGFYFEDYEYIARQKIAKSILLESKLFPKHIDDVYGEDFMRFKIGKVKMMFCETAVYRDREKKVFRGVFLSSSFNKYFQSETFVIKRRKLKILDRMRIHLGSQLHEVSLENSEFNRKFITLSTDQVGARYILTPGLMDHILAYSRKMNKRIIFSFVENRLYGTIQNIEDLFEVSLFKPINRKSVTKSLEPVLLYTDIVQDLDLNLRIWSKS